MILIDIQVLRCFITACELRSITKAADRYFISRQAVSKAIKKMEAEIGAPLLDTQQGRFELTDAGQCLYSNAQKIVEIWEKSQQEIKQMKKPVIRAGYGQMIYGRWDSEYIECFEREHTNISITTEAFMPQRLFDMLFDKSLDVVFSAASCNRDDVVSVTIVSHPLTVAMSSNDSLASKSIIDVHDFSGRTILFLKSDPVFYTNFETFFTAEQIPVRMEYTSVSETAYALSVIKPKNALHFLSGKFSLPKGFIQKRVSYVGNQTLPSQNIRAYYLKSNPKSKEIKAFINHSKNMISKHQIYTVN